MPYSYDKNRGKYTVRATVNNSRIYIGRYDNEDDAKRAEKVYLATRKRLEGKTLDDFNLFYEETGFRISSKVFNQLRQKLAPRRKGKL